MQGETEKRNRENEKKSPLKIKVYRTPHSSGEALGKSFTSLPHSPGKRKAVVGGLGKAVGLKLEREMVIKLKNTETTEKHQKVTEFYFRKDIVYTAPVMKNFITIHENGKKK